ncbi:hypothetical protein [Sphingomonas sp.]|uniref:hypothetical protein n=1 Tax=Sphingomonas sp. TaxID=28214 RepID=UPI001B2D6C86|nr:hypothetical protein [Sphingomonas sp.]MBO9712179.1 hypothetical protein [Sphingomonas sp.]
MVTTLPPMEGDCWVQVWLGGKPRMTLPIDQYQEAVDWAVAMSDQFATAVQIVPISPADLTKFLGPRLENGLASMSDEERWKLRQDVVTACALAMRDCPDPQVRAEAHSVLVTMKVIRP